MLPCKAQRRSGDPKKHGITIITLQHGKLGKHLPASLITSPYECMKFLSTRRYPKGGKGKGRASLPVSSAASLQQVGVSACVCVAKAGCPHLLKEDTHVKISRPCQRNLVGYRLLKTAIERGICLLLAAT